MKLAALLTSLAIALLGFAGGGGSSSGGGGGSSSGGGSFSSDSSSHSSSSSSSSSSGEGSIPGAFLACIIFTLIAFAAVRASEKRPAKSSINHNTTPEEKFIHQEAERIFRAYQKDWSDFNIKNIAAYTTPQYHEHATLMLELLKSLRRRNEVSNLTVHHVSLLTPVTSGITLPAKVQVEFDFGGLDRVITDAGEVLYSANPTHVTETWNFLYDGTTLRLAGISQPTESSGHLVRSLAAFAEQNRLFYSPDWGRYALPSRGLIFTDAKMQTADINNHVIGKWGDLLIQLYTYAATPSDPSSYYLVGQITLPKAYLGVIVKSKRQKSKTLRRIDRSYDRFDLEWPDFNRRYDVYAASADALPAFELLNPKFMELLYGKNPNYSLEVADNTVYIFANINQITKQDYADLLDILSAAYKELKQ